MKEVKFTRRLSCFTFTRLSVTALLSRYSAAL